MSPTVRHDPISFELDQVTSAPEPTRARAAYSFTFARARVRVGRRRARAEGRRPCPRPGLLLVFAIPLALCMNRYLCFPNEVGVTADAAILFAAMVAFPGRCAVGSVHSCSPFFAGPLDAPSLGGHAAYTRMAFNSGSTALSAARGPGRVRPAVACIRHGMGGDARCRWSRRGSVHRRRVGGRHHAGVAPRRTTRRRGRRDQLPQGCIALPLAVLGAAAGLAALGVGWWADARTAAAGAADPPSS